MLSCIASIQASNRHRRRHLWQMGIARAGSLEDRLSTRTGALKCCHGTRVRHVRTHTYMHAFTHEHMAERQVSRSRALRPRTRSRLKYLCGFDSAEHRCTGPRRYTHSNTDMCVHAPTDVLSHTHGYARSQVRTHTRARRPTLTRK